MSNFNKTVYSKLRWQLLALFPNDKYARNTNETKIKSPGLL